MIYAISENLLNDLQDGLKEQYDTFISQVKQEMQEKSRVVEEEVIKIKAEKATIQKHLDEVEDKVKKVKAREDEVNLSLFFFFFCIFNFVPDKEQVF